MKFCLNVTDNICVTVFDERFLLDLRCFVGFCLRGVSVVCYIDLIKFIWMWQIPDELAAHYLSRSGFQCPDTRVYVSVFIRVFLLVLFH